jgi:hypothetical protein
MAAPGQIRFRSCAATESFGDFGASPICKLKFGKKNAVEASVANAATSAKMRLVIAITRIDKDF